ncbi:hypothetical protein SeMB42_g05665 [Synchytrium endobioticum]|uniref:SigF-like NTF2-like domain-containing protein n=1 Tax=Synchytrium endobioticum TaxID=286115 RepID=A0A507CQ12_9FUNG|nr:hypothetical protein SeMB42_g05665 [Synchytrium endobioticum]
MDTRTWLRNVVLGTTTTDITSIHHVLDTCYADDMKLIHPYFIAQGRDQAFQICEAWSGINETLHAQIHHIAINEDERSAFVEYSQFFKNKLLGAYFPMRLRVTTLFKWHGAAENRRIHYHRDIPQFSSMISSIPVVGGVYNFIRPKATSVLSSGYQVANKVGLFYIMPRFINQFFPILQYVSMLSMLPFVNEGRVSTVGTAFGKYLEEDHDE